MIVLHFDITKISSWLVLALAVLELVVIFFLLARTKNRIFQKQQSKLKRKIRERTKELLRLNSKLQERNEEVSRQSSELHVQKENLLETNKLLEINKKKVEDQKEELEKHRFHLEELVRERTRELEVSKQKAEESEKLKMAFLSNMSHEIRTPMNAVLGFASLLNERSLSAEEQLEYIEQINKNGQSLMVLIDDIIDLSKIEANQIELRKETFELHRFLKEVYLNQKKLQLIEKSDIELKLDLPADQKALFIHTDKLRITQVLSYLLSNAIKFTERGTITLGFEFFEKNIVIFVRDTGIGISEENKTLIFDRFRKIENNLDKLYRGAGLGLTISMGLAKKIGGTLWLESEPGKGSVFYFQLPYERPKKIPSDIIRLKNEKVKEPDTQFDGHTALVVEDDENNYAFLKELLRKKKFDVDWAKDGQEACDLFNSQKRYDIVLMDIKMPVMNGVDATHIIKEKFPDQLIVAQTAFAGISDWHKYKGLGFDGLVTKPVRSRELINMISTLLKKSS